MLNQDGWADGDQTGNGTDRKRLRNIKKLKIFFVK